MTALAYALIAVFALPLAFGSLAIVAFLGATVFGIFEQTGHDIKQVAQHG
jgi:EamA domain-containing membrane protein RarD